MSTGRRSVKSSNTRSGRVSAARRGNSRSAKRKKKKNNIVPILLMMAVLLGILVLAYNGTQNSAGKTSYDTSTAVFEKNGRLQVTSVETFDQDYYNADELEEYIRNEVKSANASTKKVDLKAISVADGTARMEIIYDSPQDYWNFNNCPAYYGSLKGAQEAGFNFESLMSAASQADASKIFANDDFNTYADKTTAVICEKMNVIVPRDILFASNNLKITSKRTAEAVSDINEELPAIIIMK